MTRSFGFRVRQRWLYVVVCAATLIVLHGPHVGPIHAQQTPAPTSSSSLLHRLQQLATVGSVLYVAAHPDDENTRLLAYLRGELHLDTTYLSLTRGDGGQNLIGPEQGPLLGLIRTQELLAARRVDGAAQLFTRARDFGYSKTATETLAIWNREEVLSDVVWAIRRTKPDVILTRFPTSGMETHGHHTASAILAEEAFWRAGDATYQPAQVALVGAWQAKRILWNRSQWGSKPSDDLRSFLQIEVGGYNPLLGASYGELAATSRTMHKSQGFGSSPTRGSQVEYFKPLHAAPGSSLVGLQGPFDGIDLSSRRIPGSEHWQRLLEQAEKELLATRPAAAVPTLFLARAELLGLADGPWKAGKLRALEELIADCLGLYVEATAGEHSLAVGERATITVSAVNRSDLGMTLQSVGVAGTPEQRVDRPLLRGEVCERQVVVPMPPLQGGAGPSWLRLPPEKGLYPVAELREIGLPEREPALVATVTLQVALAAPNGAKDGGTRAVLTLHRPVVYKWVDPVAGERVRHLEGTPPILLDPASKTVLFPRNEKRPLSIVLTAAKAPLRGVLRLQLPAGFSATPTQVEFALAQKGDTETVTFQLMPSAGAGTGGGTLRVQAEIAGEIFEQGLQTIDYPHIPIQTLYPPATVNLVRLDLAKPTRPVGYITGAGDDVATALRQVGYEVIVLDEEALRQGTLQRFGAIVVGVRALNTRKTLMQHRERLLAYVAAGGNLIMQYNTNNRIAKLSASLGPFPFEISQDRVTEEDAEVVLEQPIHPVLLRPHRIVPADFTGWQQERGLYFAGSWDARYQTVLSMHDAGETPKKGSLIIARHGKGTFVYTGLAFFRQLPAGVPGAYRLFANLLAQGQ